MKARISDLNDAAAASDAVRSLLHLRVLAAMLLYHVIAFAMVVLLAFGCQEELVLRPIVRRIRSQTCCTGFHSRGEKAVSDV